MRRLLRRGSLATKVYAVQIALVRRTVMLCETKFDLIDNKIYLSGTKRKIWFVQNKFLFDIFKRHGLKDILYVK